MTNLEQAIVAMNKVLECVSVIKRNDFYEPTDLLNLENTTSNYLIHIEVGTIDLEILKGIEELLDELLGVCSEISDRNERRFVADMDSWYDTRYL